MSATSPAFRVAGAIRRAHELLRILDREHNVAELYRQLKGVRHEVDSALRLLPEPAAPGNISTSAQRARGTKPGSHRHVLMQKINMADGPRTSPALARECGINIGVVRTRLHELASAGWIEPVATLKDQVTERFSTAWEVSDLGQSSLRKLESGQLVLIELPDES